VITIFRDNEYIARGRKYKIYVDDVYRDKIGLLETKEIEVSNGEHTIYAKIDWCSSNRLKTFIDNKDVFLNVGATIRNGLNLFETFKYTYFDTKDYLWIKQTSE